MFHLLYLVAACGLVEGELSNCVAGSCHIANVSEIRVALAFAEASQSEMTQYPFYFEAVCNDETDIVSGSVGVGCVLANMTDDFTCVAGFCFHYSNNFKKKYDNWQCTHDKTDCQGVKIGIMKNNHGMDPLASQDLSRISTVIYVQLVNPVTNCVMTHSGWHELSVEITPNSGGNSDSGNSVDNLLNMFLGATLQTSKFSQMSNMMTQEVSKTPLFTSSNVALSTEVMTATQSTEVMTATQSTEVMTATQSTEVMTATQSMEVMTATPSTEVVTATQSTEVVNASSTPSMVGTPSYTMKAIHSANATNAPMFISYSILPMSQSMISPSQSIGRMSVSAGNQPSTYVKCHQFDERDRKWRTNGCKTFTNNGKYKCNCTVSARVALIQSKTEQTDDPAWTQPAVEPCSPVTTTITNESGMSVTTTQPSNIDSSINTSILSTRSLSGNPTETSVINQPTTTLFTQPTTVILETETNNPPTTEKPGDKIHCILTFKGLTFDKSNEAGICKEIKSKVKTTTGRTVYNCSTEAGSTVVHFQLYTDPVHTQAVLLSIKNHVLSSAISVTVKGVHYAADKNHIWIVRTSTNTTPKVAISPDDADDELSGSEVAIIVVTVIIAVIGIILILIIVFLANKHEEATEASSPSSGKHNGDHENLAYTGDV